MPEGIPKKITGRVTVSFLQFAEEFQQEFIKKNIKEFPEKSSIDSKEEYPEKYLHIFHKDWSTSLKKYLNDEIPKNPLMEFQKKNTRRNF